uniref:APO domain-containing protein n=1 Tax=Brassica oleracea var. oleracea TaxID=109376 RepID=A0A0D3BFY4_BRAOL
MQRRKLVVQISQFPMKELIRRAKEERKSQPCRVLEDPPDNGLLVPELVHVAHRVHRCRASLLSGLSTIIHHHIQRFCFEVHIGKEGHEILWGLVHLYDRAVKPRVVHYVERFTVPKISALLELCIQAGVGVRELMERYKAWTCGYCPEIQEASIDDVVGPNSVWHVRDPDASALDNSLQRFYGKAPAVVELCVRGGAPVPEQYKSMMRLDVVYPQRDEVDLVA